MFFSAAGATRDGFSPVDSASSYQMVPADGGERRVTVDVHGGPWTFQNSNPERVTVRADGCPTWPTLQHGQKVTLILIGSKVPGMATLTFSTSPGAPRKLLVSVLPSRPWTYSMGIILSDAAKDHSSEYDRAKINAATWGMERALERFANVKASCQAWADLRFPDRFLGTNEILWEDHWEAIKKAMPMAATHHVLVWCWNIESRHWLAQGTMCYALTDQGITITDAGMPWVGITHEFGHSLGLGDDESPDKANFMHWGTQDPPHFSHSQIEAMNGFNTRPSEPAHIY